MALLQLSILLLAHVSLRVVGFNFSFGHPGECDPLSLSWSGGQPPFQLLIIPPGGTMKNVSIPASAFNDTNRQGSYTLPQLAIKEEQQFMLSMSDKTGTFAGGTSNLMTMGAAQNGQPCNTTYPNPDFTFSLDSDLAQCSPFPVTLYPGPVAPVLPVRLLVNIPQGQSFVVNLSLDSSSPWIANLTAGTPAAFTVLDAQNRDGGTEVLRVAKPTNDTSCLSSSTPSAGPSSTAGNDAHTHKSITGLAIGTSVGGFALLCIVLAFLWFYRRRRMDEKRPSSFLDLSGGLDDRRTPYQLINLHRTSNASSKVRSVQENVITDSPGSPLRPAWQSPGPAQSQQATSVTAYTPPVTARSTGDHPSDIIIHRDITESARPVEFPPQYSANFGPIPSVLLRDLASGQNRM